jgi:hypothetical protein
MNKLIAIPALVLAGERLSLAAMQPTETFTSPRSRTTP